MLNHLHNLPCLILDLLCQAKRLTPYDRYDAMRKGITGLDNPANRTHWAFLAVLCVLAAAAAALAVYVAYRWISHYRSGRDFLRRAAQAGLNEPEQKLLARVAQEAGLKDPAELLGGGVAFDHGVARLMRSKRVAQFSGTMKANTAAVLNSLRVKLSSRAGSASQGGLLEIPAGAQLMVASRAPHSREFAVTASSFEPRRLTVTRNHRIRCEVGDAWLIRYYDGQSTWEFQAEVVEALADRVVVSHGGVMQFVDRRRFLRVSASRSAEVAAFPLLRPPEQAAEGSPDAIGRVWGSPLPAFVPAELVEIAGPGLQLEAALSVRSQERVLVMLRLPGGKLAQGVGLVHRCEHLPNGLNRIALELLGLNNQELAEMAEQGSQTRDIAFGSPLPAQQEMATTSPGQASNLKGDTPRLAADPPAGAANTAPAFRQAAGDRTVST